MANKIYLADYELVLDVQCKLVHEQSLKSIPQKQKQASIKPLDYFANMGKLGDENIADAYLSGRYTLERVTQHF